MVSTIGIVMNRIEEGNTIGRVIINNPLNTIFLRIEMINDSAE